MCLDLAFWLLTEIWPRPRPPTPAGEQAGCMKVTIEVNVLRVVGDTHVALTELAGIRVRGKKADSPAGAVRNLLWSLAGYANDDDADLAVELVVAGTSLPERLALDDAAKS